jgi:hypothetical protein
MLHGLAQNDVATDDVMTLLFHGYISQRELDEIYLGCPFIS